MYDARAVRVRGAQEDIVSYEQTCVHISRAADGKRGNACTG